MVQILIISDGKIEEGVMESNGVQYDIFGAHDIEDACRQSEKFQPDVILVQMRRIKGAEGAVYDEIRSIKECKKIPIMIFTDDNVREELETKLTQRDRRVKFLPMKVERQEVFAQINAFTGAIADREQKQILVIDEDPTVLEVVREFLSCRYKVVTARTAGDGCQMARQLKPALVILAVSLPDMDGRDLYKTLKQDKDTSSIPFFFQTGNTTAEIVRSCMRLNPAGFMIKPIQKETLRRNVEYAVDHIRQKKIFLITGDMILKDAFAKALAEEAKCEIADSKINAVNILGTQSFDTVIMDMDTMAFCMDIVMEKLQSKETQLFLITRNPEEILQIQFQRTETFILKRSENLAILANQIFRRMGM